MFEIMRKCPAVHLERGLVSYAYRIGSNYVSVANATSSRFVKIKDWLSKLEERKEVVERDFPNLREPMLLGMLNDQRICMMSICASNEKDDKAERKAVYKRVRKEYLSYGKLAKKSAINRKEKIIHLLIKLRLLWPFYRLKFLFRKRKR